MSSYNPSNFIQQISIDCTIFGYAEGSLKVLVTHLNFNGDFKALPAGFVYQDESLDEAAYRILVERTGLKDIYLEQFHTFGGKERSHKDFLNKLISLNPEILPEDTILRQETEWFTKRFISVGYYALVDINKVRPTTSTIDKYIGWYDVDELPPLIFDHNEQVKRAQTTLRFFLDEKLLGFNLLPETFTMKELKNVYETVYDRPFRRNNFQKKMLDLNVLERLDKKFTGAANKAPYLYRFKKVP
ncbi:NUDIX hydrolase [Maribacter flavus]|uniref:NUDIX hydrolase n=1 Tax=Maribacter flavus TaxID=1658664 RepID=A0A5B2TNG6_9FLAO|nr:NUDIX domain-containing protein [Maribacter flavus]KAA2215764.1 NUDIX hydrolase [Maribacter flavus]